ncbi:MAG: hypothetical protein JHC38_11205, partial [Thiotrichales bacterium]|nr:hypothetical protein [Thiotrichales bacterium]
MEAIDILKKALVKNFGEEQAKDIIKASEDNANLPPPAFPVVHTVNTSKSTKTTKSSKKRASGTLPVWSEEKRGIPHALIRTAIFGLVKKGEKRRLKNEVIASIDGMTVRQTGSQLDQNDLAVWMQLIHLARLQGT